MTNGSGSARARAAAIRLLRWYPRPWRSRYLVEMQALLQQMPVTWRQVANLAFTGVREWCSPRALGWPARSAAGRVQAARMIGYFTLAVAIDIMARIAGWKLRAAGVTVPDAVTGLFSVTILFAGIRALVATIRYERHKKAFPKLPEYRRPGMMHGWEIAMWAVLLSGSLVVRHTEGIPSYMSPPMATLRPYTDFLNVLLWSNFLLLTSARSRRLGRLQRAWRLRELGYRRTPLI